MLETVRQHAREKLDGARDVERLQRRHRDYLLASLESKLAVASSAQWQEWLRRLMSEVDNVRLAPEWPLGDTSSVEAAPRMLIALVTMWPFTIVEHSAWRERAIGGCQRHATIPRSLPRRTASA